MSCMLILRKICTHRIKCNRRKVGILHFIHNLANPFICSHIIIEAMQRCHPDSRFLAATAIMQHIMARAKPLVLSEMIEIRSEEHTSVLQSRENLVCCLLLEKNKK